MSDASLYAGREQTLVKHFVLREYLKRFAHIIGFGWNGITYVDCFSGPWQQQSEELKDTSFSIALHQLREARATHQAKGKALRLRCLFLEKDPAAYLKLKQFADGIKDMEVETRNSELAGAVDDVLKFVRAGGRDAFPFVFIDPTGWTGFGMDLIAPLLCLRPGEVLINFMTDYVRRFIDHPDEGTRAQFATLFGSANVKTSLEGLADPADREDALVRSYAEAVRQTGRYTYTCVAIVFYPEIDRTYFHLVYATRNRKGVEVFKSVEQRAMETMEQARAEAKQRKRVKQTGQQELFSSQEMPHSRPIDALRQRYQGQARRRLTELLESQRRVNYETAWDLALSYALVWECDLKDWIGEWCGAGSITIEGMAPRQRVPRLDQNNVLVWHPNV